MRTYRIKRSRIWWLEDWHSMRYVAKQFSGIMFVYMAVLWTSCVLAIGANDPETLERMTGVLKHPMVLFLNFFALAFAVIHMMTWFSFLPKIVLAEKSRRMSAMAIIGTCYAIACMIAFGIMRKGGVL